jgi:hypothetical protein
MFVQVGQSGRTSVIGNVLVNADVAQGDDAKAKEEAYGFYLPAIARLANERQLASGRQRDFGGDEGDDETYVKAALRRSQGGLEAPGAAVPIAAIGLANNAEHWDQARYCVVEKQVRGSEVQSLISPCTK